MSKPADSVRFEVVNKGDKEAHEEELTRRAVTFFGHPDFTTTGFRHDTTEPAMGLRTVAIFYDETPYTDEGA